MIKWAHFLHIYQPSDQHPGILEKIVNESYRPLIKGFYKTENTKVTLNVNAVLTELLFQYGYRDVIEDIQALVEMGRLELTGSAKFHAFLPLLPESEVERQILLNHETNSRYFREAFKPKGFFSPEMGYSPKVASVVKKLGYEWMLIDEVSMSEASESIDYSKMYEVKDMKLGAFFREKRPSNIIMGALTRSAESFKKAIGDRMDSKELSYIITAMDGETFGHHRPGLEESLLNIFHSSEFDNVFISDLDKYFKEVIQVEPMDSTWASSIKDVSAGNPFNLWFDKSNKIHTYEWDLAGLAIKTVNDSKFSDAKYPKLLEDTKSWDEMTSDEKQNEEKKRQWIKSRDALDKALNSDPWWWASAKPWWSVEMIEKGMNALYKVVMIVPDATSEVKDEAEELYRKILFTAHEWQRGGIVDKMAEEESKERSIPLSKRFGADAHYKALLEALKKQEKKASENREYEQAIKWRDAQYKLERDLDIYDAVHIMDLFRLEGDFKQFEKLLEKYREEYKKLSKGQPE